MKKLLLLAAVAGAAMSSTAEEQTLMSRNQQIQTKLEAKLFRFTTNDGQQLTLPEIAAQHRAKAEGESGPAQTIEGPTELYQMDAILARLTSAAEYNGLAQKVQIQSDCIYFSNIMPNLISGDAPVKAELAADGTVTLKEQDYYYGLNYYNLNIYFFDCTIVPIDVDEEGNYVPTEGGYKMVYNPEDGTIITPGDNLMSNANPNGDAYYIGLFADMSSLGYEGPQLLSYCVNPRFAPFNAPEPAVVPENAEAKEFVYSFAEQYGSPKAIKDVAYVDGNDLYLTNLTGSVASVVKGTVEGDKLIVPSGQFLPGTTFLLSLQGAKNFVYDPYQGIIDYEAIDALTFTQDADGTYNLDEGQTLVLRAGSGDGVFSFIDNIHLSFYTGPKPAIPATPDWYFVYDYVDYYGMWSTAVLIPCVGTKGEFLDEDCMEWAIYTDEDINVFSPDEGYDLDQDYTWMGYHFSDNSRDNIIDNGSYKNVWMFAGLYETLGVQTRYLCDGVYYYSDIMYYDLATDQTYVVEIEREDPTNIQKVSETKAQQNLFDLQGRRIREAKGMHIQNGSVTFVK